MTELEIAAIAWRNEELKKSDWLVQVADHPERPLYYTYRQALRDWPDTIKFPETRPTI